MSAYGKLVVKIEVLDPSVTMWYPDPVRIGVWG